MGKTLKLGKKQLSKQEEMDIIELRNSTKSPSFYRSAILTRAITDGLSGDIWADSFLEPRAVQLRNILQQYFTELFKWEGVDYNFYREAEYILFRYGKVAIIKIGEDYYPCAYTFDSNDLDFYNEPKKIMIQHKNEAFNGKIIKKGDFILGYNNSNRYGTLTWVWEDIRQYVRARIGVDNASILSTPKMFWAYDSDSSEVVDLNNAINSTDMIVPVADLSVLKNANVDIKQGNSVVQDRTLIVEKQLEYLLDNIGLKTSGGNQKAERMTELEIANNDKFKGLIIENMITAREELFKRAKEEFKLNITLEEKELEMDELNGEENKNKIEGENNGK